jgi:hypothetical protein
MQEGDVPGWTGLELDGSRWERTQGSLGPRAYATSRSLIAGIWVPNNPGRHARAHHPGAKLLSLSIFRKSARAISQVTLL